MKDNVAIRLSNVNKSFKIKVRNKDKTGLIKNKYNTVNKKVLDNISLEIKKGEVLGVIGRNGSGKSTLLSIIAGIMFPDSGTIDRFGRIASILELGMGFHPDMSGRENIYLKGELYGFSKKDLDSRIEKIIDYSGISEYIDNPVRTYSSGMTGRLAFSIMINVDSDIMIVDEVLSVGDTAFMLKAKEHFKRLSNSGKTIIFVSHDLRSLEDMCSHVIWIENGTINKSGPPKEVCSFYREKIENSPDVVKNLAEAGVRDAQYKLALMYRDGQIDGSNNLPMYEKWIKESANQGYAPAQVSYADILLESNKDNYRKSMMYYHLAANSGSTLAQKKLASYAMKEKIDFSWAKEFTCAHVNIEDPIQICKYAELLMTLSENTAEQKESFKWFKKAADLGYPNAMHKVALLYRDGVGTKVDNEKVIEYLEKANKMGYTPSTIMLADYYLVGKYVGRDEKRSFELYSKMAIIGDSKSEYQVAKMYYDGTGTNINEELSNEWLSRYSASSLQWFLSWSVNLLKNEENLNINKIIELLNILIDQGNIIASDNAISMCSLGSIKDKTLFDKALNMMINLAECGNIDAIRRIGNYYYEGLVIKKDLPEAAKWYEKAVKIGDPWSTHRMADMYRNGIGVSQNIKKATELYLKIGEQGNTVALNNIIEMHISNIIDDQTLFDKALNMMINLAECGNIDAIRRIRNYSNNEKIMKDLLTSTRLSKIIQTDTAIINIKKE